MVFGFPDKFINFLKVLLKDAQIILDVNGIRSQPFLLKDGTGQGDPISSFLFNLCIELFIIKMQFHQSTKMFTIGQIPTTPEAFADDVHIYVAGDHPESLPAITKIAADFANLSGLHLSTQKTEFLSIGATPEMCDQARICGLKTVDKIKFVAAWVTATPGTEETDMQFLKPIEKIELVDRSWAWRRPSPYGATIIIRSLMASTTTHLLSNFDMGNQQLQYINNLFTKLLWASTNRHHTRKDRLIQPISKGGMNIISIPDFTMALRIQWFRKLCHPNPSIQNWRIVLNHYLAKYGIRDVDIPYLGWRDLKRLGIKLVEDKFRFWGTNFQHLSSIAKLWEESTTNIGMLPLFGGLIQEKAESSWLSIFDNNIPSVPDACLRMFHNGIRLATHVFHTHSINRVDSWRRGNAQEWGLQPNMMYDFNNSAHAVVRAKRILGETHKITRMRYPRNYMGTQLFYKCTYTKKGSSFAYKALIKEKAVQAGFLVNPSYLTWQNSTQHQIPMDKWIRNIELIKTINFSPRAKWRTYQQFLRTVWTPMKSYWSYGDEDDANCPSCGEFGADTTHILVDCTVAQTTWKHISSILSEYHDSRFQISKEQILFHHPLSRKMNIGVIIAAKTAIWKILWNVSSQPIHPKVIKCHLKTQLHLLIDTNLRIFNKDANWWRLKSMVNSTIK